VNVRLTEDRFIQLIKDAAGPPPRRIRCSIGDDAAVWKVRRSRLSLLTTDALIDGVHFIADRMSPAALGHKALAVSLSDIAAMGGAPSLAVIALGLNGRVDETWTRELYRGMAKLGARFACAIAGGDVVRAGKLMLAVTVAGEVRRSDLRLRSGAKPGDVLCVTGPLGLAAAGLRVVRGDAVPEAGKPHAAGLRAAYETPWPRLREGAMLAASRATHALMDISDGLSLDVARMATASGVDVCLDAAALRKAIPPQIAPFEDALDLMLHGGDDYELLAAVDGRAYGHLARRFARRFGRALQAVGHCEKGTGKVWWVEGATRAVHVPRGYDHLLDRANDFSGAQAGCADPSGADGTPGLHANRLEVG
jgi:thiamine-monophosphate kinase